MDKVLRFLDDRIIHPCLGFLPLLLVAQVFWSVQIRAQAIAQTGDLESKIAVHEERLQDEDRRLNALEGLKIDSRLTAIETQLRTGNTLQYTSTGGLVCLVAEAFIRRRRKYADSDEKESRKFAEKD